MTSNSTVSLGAFDGTTEAHAYANAFVVVWPSFVLALTSIAIACAVVTTTTGASSTSSQGHYSPLRRNEFGGRGLLAQVGLLICATVLHPASSISFVPRDESFSPSADANATSTDYDYHGVPLDPREALSASVYLTVFVNILCNLAAVSSSTGFRDGTTAKYRHCHPSTDDVMRSTSIANLGPMVYSILLVMESRGNGMALKLSNYNQWHMIMVSYAMAFVVIQFIQGLMKKRRGQRSVLAGIPLVDGSRYGRESEKASMPSPRVERWHEWSAEEVAQWVSSLPRLGSSSMTYSGISIGRSKSSGTCSNQHYASILQEECVDGIALASITVDTLRSFGLPYGHATALRKIIESELISRYGRGDLELLVCRDASIRDGPLFDSNGLEGRSDLPPGQESVAVPVDSIDPNMAEKASELFAERFGGLKLANFETGESPTALSRISPAGTARRVASLGVNNTLGTINEESAAVKEDEGRSSPLPAPPHQLSEALLSSMPPDVREVALRRPELFRTMLRNRGIVSASSGTSNGNTSPAVASSSASEIEMASYWNDDDDDVEEASSSSDMVSLLRRRPTR